MSEYISFETEDDDGYETEYKIPAKWVVCNMCRGRGNHVNPSIDSHGITAEEWDRDWSYEDRENYMNGFYDVSCYECHGRTTVLEPDWELLEKTNPDLAEKYDQYLQSEADYHRLCEQERKYGC